MFGDFNYRAASDPPVALGQAQPALRLLHAPPPSGSHKNLWEATLTRLVELHRPNPTHYTQSSGQLTRIDKGYSTMPGSVLIKLGITAAISEGPESLHSKGLSDHSAVGFSFAPKFLVRNGTFSFPKAWFNTPAFAGRLKLLITKIDCLSLHPLDQLEVYKRCLKSAAFHARDVLQNSNPDGSESRRMILEAMSRAVWRNDRKIADKIISVSSFAAQHLGISNGRVLPVNFQEFEIYTPT